MIYYIIPETLEIYVADIRGPWNSSHIKCESEQPTSWHKPVIEDSKHVGWIEDVEACKQSFLNDNLQSYLHYRNNEHTIHSEVLNTIINCRANDVLNIKTIVELHEAGLDKPDFYKTCDNTKVPCSKEQFKLVYKELQVGQLELWNLKDHYEEQIKQAQTVEELMNIQLNYELQSELEESSPEV